MGFLLAGISMFLPLAAQASTLGNGDDSVFALVALRSLSVHDESNVLFDDGGLSRHCRLD